MYMYITYYTCTHEIIIKIQVTLSENYENLLAGRNLFEFSRVWLLLEVSLLPLLAHLADFARKREHFILL